MRTGIGTAARRILLLTSLCGSAQALASNDNQTAVTVELRVFVHASLDARNLGLARESALALLATAGIAGKWRDCSAGCGGGTNEPLSILVQLLPMTKMSAPDVCGEATRDGRTGMPTVLIYVPPHAELVHAFRFGAGTRSNPVLQGVQTGHLVGLTLAHEVGHVSGLSHAGSGLMKARPNVGEIVALRTSRLRFDAVQAARMRHALRPPMVTIVADARK